jgi:hypothetical protein
MTSVTVITPTGCIGNRGIDADVFRQVIESEQPDVIAVDAGSADCGPWYLGSGRAHSPRRNIEWDISVLLDHAVSRGIPVIIGSAGGSGTRAHVDATVETISRLARQRNLKFRMAAIYADVDPDYILAKQQGGQIAVHRAAPTVPVYWLQTCAPATPSWD